MLPIRYQRDPFSGEGARLYGERWNARGIPALYLGLVHATAVAEFLRDMPKPGTLVPYRVSAHAIADLTGAGGPSDSSVASALETEWKTIAVLGRDQPPRWSIADQLTAC